MKRTMEWNDNTRIILESHKLNLLKTTRENFTENNKTILKIALRWLLLSLVTIIDWILFSGFYHHKSDDLFSDY